MIPIFRILHIIAPRFKSVILKDLILKDLKRLKSGLGFSIAVSLWFRKKENN